MDKIIADSDINFIYDMIMNATVQDTSQIISVSWQQLQIKASNFIEAYNKLKIQEYIENKSLLSKLKQSLGNNSKFLTETDGIKVKRMQYALAFQFDNYLTAFLGELPKKALYIIEGKNGLETYELSLLSLAKAVSGGKLDLSKSFLEAESLKVIEEQQKTDKNFKEHLDQVSRAYSGASARLNRSYEVLGTTGGRGFLMWKIGSYWNIARVANKGDLKEAYIAALMIEHQSTYDHLYGISPGNPPYQSHELIDAFYNWHIGLIDNTPAIINEDVITQNLQYAVKSVGASLPAISQYVKTANYIKSRATPLSASELKSWMEFEGPGKGKGVLRNKVLKVAEETAEWGYNDIVKEFYQGFEK